MIKQGMVICLLASMVVVANYVEKTQLEAHLQAKAQHILDTMHGSGVFSVSAEVIMGNESWTVDYTDQASVTFSGKKNTASEGYQILPGYEAIKNLSPNEAVQMPFNSIITKEPPLIAKITLNVVASNTIKKRDVKAMNRILTEVLNLHSERGDAIHVRYESFPVKRQVENIQVGLPKEIKLMIILIGVASLFFIVYIILQIKHINVNKDAVKAARATAKATASAARSGSMSMSNARTTEKDDAKAPEKVTAISGYFDYVHDQNVDMFGRILAQLKINNDELAIVVSFVHPSIGKKILSHFSEGIRSAVIQLLSIEVTRDKNHIDQLNNQLKVQLECTIGGVSKVTTLMSTFNDTDKKSMLSAIKSTPDVYNLVRAQTLLFEDISLLSNDDVKRLIATLNLEVLATAIIEEASPASEKISSNLTGAAQAMVRQFIDLKKESLSTSQIAMAQKLVVQEMKTLDENGSIDLSSKIVA